jgi:hypothetical protein
MSPAARLAAQELFARGDISWLLHPEQLKAMQWYEQRYREVAVYCINRQFGKTFMLLAYAVAYCLSKPKMSVLMLAPHLDQLETILMPRLNFLFQFLADEQVPLRRKESWTFRNGSVLRLDGIAVGRGVRVRGGSVHLVICDECRDVPDLTAAVESHISPMTVTTKGRIILSSTPPDTISHSFTDKFIREAIQRGDFYSATYKQNPLLPTERLRYLMETMYPGGEENIIFRREYMADYSVSDPELRVVREWDEGANDRFFEEEYIGSQQNLVRPYTALDFASSDPCGILVGHFDPIAGCLIIEEEWFQRHMNTNDVATKIIEMEQRHHRRLPRKLPVIRIMDIDPRLMADLYTGYQLRFEPAAKSNSNIAMINRLRIIVAEGKLRVHPRCTQLKFQLRTGVFNAKMNDYLRTDRTGHLDLVDAAKYLALGVRWRELLHEPPPEVNLRHDQLRIGGFVGETFRHGLLNRPG